MRSEPFSHLPEGLQETILAAFPPLRGREGRTEVLWLEAMDFPRLRVQDLTAGHPRLLLGRRRWRICHLAGEETVEPFEPVLVLERAPPAAPPAPRPGAWDRLRGAPRAWLPAAALAVAAALLLAVALPRHWTVLEAEPLHPEKEAMGRLLELWGEEHAGEALRLLEETEAAVREVLLPMAGRHPSPRVREAARRLGEAAGERHR